MTLNLFVWDRRVGEKFEKETVRLKLRKDRPHYYLYLRNSVYVPVNRSTRSNITHLRLQRLTLLLLAVSKSTRQGEA